MTLKLDDDCFVLDKDRLPHHEALAILKARVRTVASLEEVSLADATGRFLAEAILSPRLIPAHDNAAVDGYASPILPTTRTRELVSRLRDKPGRVSLCQACLR